MLLTFGVAFQATSQQLSGEAEGDPRVHFVGNPKDYKVPSSSGENTAIYTRSVICCPLLAVRPYDHNSTWYEICQLKAILNVFPCAALQRKQKSMLTSPRHWLRFERWSQPWTSASVNTNAIRGCRRCGAAWRTAAWPSWRMDTPSVSRTWWDRDKHWNTRACSCGRPPLVGLKVRLVPSFFVRLMCYSSF